MLKIRLQRVGRKHEPTFRVVLTDSKNSTKSGRFLEILGSYDPRKTVDSLQGARISEWMSKGAQVSDTVHNLLVKHKIIEGKKKNVLPRKSPYKTEAKLAEEKVIADKAAAEAKALADKEVAEKAEAQAAKEAEEAAKAEAEANPIPEPVAETPVETPAEVVESPEEVVEAPEVTDPAPNAEEAPTA